jgi:dihydroorotate dehydrogenase (fumarate)
MIDLSTTYLGLELKNPLVPSASPLSRSLDTLRRLEDHGAAAVVLYSLFEEQITFESRELDHFLSYGTDSFAESLSYFPEPDSFHTGPDEYLAHIRAAKDALGIPVIASLNGVSTGGWVRYARLMQDAGADALELNMYFIPTNPAVTGEAVESTYVSLARDVKASVSIPVSLKLNPFVSSLPNLAAKFDEVGIDGLALFNRFYQPDFNLESLEVVPNLVLSDSSDLLMRLRWVAILYKRIKADLAITGGVHSADDVIKAMMAGSKVAMMASALLSGGIGQLEKVLGDVREWLVTHEYEGIKQMQGSMSQQNVTEPAAF